MSPTRDGRSPSRNHSAATRSRLALGELGSALSRLSDDSQREALVVVSRCLSSVLLLTAHDDDLNPASCVVRLARALDRAIRHSAAEPRQLERLAATMERFAPTAGSPSPPPPYSATPPAAYAPHQQGGRPPYSAAAPVASSASAQPPAAPTSAAPAPPPRPSLDSPQTRGAPAVSDVLARELQARLLEQCSEIRSLVEREHGLTTSVMNSRLERRGSRRGGLFGTLGGGGRFLALLIPLLVIVASMAVGWVWAAHVTTAMPQSTQARSGARGPFKGAPALAAKSATFKVPRRGYASGRAAAVSQPSPFAWALA